MNELRAPDTATGQKSHDIGVPDRLLEFMREGWEPAPLTATEAPIAPFAAERRAKLSALFPGDVLVIASGGLKTRANDTEYRFRPGSDYFWLTGEMEPDGVLVMTPTAQGHEATLFVSPRSDTSTTRFYTDRMYGELWVGPRPGVEETRVSLAIETAARPDLAATLARVGAGPHPVRVLRGYDTEVDAAVSGDEHADQQLAEALSELRLIKDSHEVEMLVAACEATKLGFEDVLRELPQAIATSERWIEGTFDRRARVEGNDVGYGSICAAGSHATTLHWTRNDGDVRPGELMLLDMGVEGNELYTADITRTFPISGTFTPLQREIYNVVLAAQDAAIAACRPGAGFMDPHNAAHEVLVAALDKWGILPCSAAETLQPEVGLHRRYTLHSVSHMLGLDVHDCASARAQYYREGVLEPGMCLTCEPGLYFQVDDLTVPEEFRGIGIRIEDDILITDDGHRNLSEMLPRSADDVEAWMASLRR